MIRRKFYTFAEDNAKIKLKIEDPSHAVSDKTFFEHKDTKSLSPKAKYRIANIAAGKISRSKYHEVNIAAGINIVYPRITLIAIKHYQ